MAKLYTPSQVAEILQVSVPTIKRWLLNGELPGVKIGPAGQWRIKSDELAAYVDSNRKKEIHKLKPSREALKDE